MKSVYFLTLLICISGACSGNSASLSSSLIEEEIARKLSQGISSDEPWLRVEHQNFGVTGNIYSLSLAQVATTVSDQLTFVASDYQVEAILTNDNPQEIQSLSSHGATLYHPSTQFMEIRMEENLSSLQSLELGLSLLEVSYRETFTSFNDDDMKLWSFGLDTAGNPYAERTQILGGQLPISVLKRYTFGLDKMHRYRLRSFVCSFSYSESINVHYQTFADYYYEGEWGNYVNQNRYEETGPETESLGAEGSPIFGNPYLRDEGEEYYFQPTIDYSKVLSRWTGASIVDDWYLFSAKGESTRLCLQNGAVPSSLSLAGNVFGVTDKGNFIDYLGIKSLLSTPIK